ncbi:MAG: pilus motility taxis protein HmpF [Cyanobacteria bacterium P01_A01_bin.135]
MLYLAEVQKKTRVLGSGKTEFKLLARQQSEYSWTSASEDLIPAPDDVPYNSGTLVLVDLSSNRQIQRHSEAGRQLVGILQNFSRLQEKSKNQEEEIEQWKQSLTYQSQELNRREMEMEAQQEELSQLETDFEQLEQQRQEIEAEREQLVQLQAECERKSQELEGAWAHLNGERRRFDERQTDSAESPEQLQALAHSLDQLSGFGALKDVSPELMPDALAEHLEAVERQQQHLAEHWQTFEARRSELEVLQGAIDEDEQGLRERWQRWHESNQSWQRDAAAVAAQQSTLATKRDLLNSLTTAAQQQSDLLAQLKGSPRTPLSLEDKIDRSALEAMPIEELRTKVSELEADFRKSSQFVSSQEEELQLQQQAIDDLKGRIEQANEYDRLQMETQLADEVESYRMLDHTLVGQRRNLQEREMLLKRHQAILAQRTGEPFEADSALEADAALTQASSVHQMLMAQAEQLKEEIAAAEGGLQNRQESVDEQERALEDELDQLKQAEAASVSDRVAAAQLEGQVRLYQEILQPVQDAFDQLRQQLPALRQAAERLQSAQDDQTQVICELRSTISQVNGAASTQLSAS